MGWQDKENSCNRKGQKRKLDHHEERDPNTPSGNFLRPEINAQVGVLTAKFSWKETDRAAAKKATHALAELAKNEDVVSIIVEGGAIPVLVKHLQAPPLTEVDRVKHHEHEVEKASVFALGLLAVKPEHQQRIVDAGALPLIVDLLKRHKKNSSTRAVCGVIRRAADAITNLAHENSCIKTCVRAEEGIPPLAELLEFSDAKVQKAVAGALRTLAFKNDENKKQIVECNALPALILMLRSVDAAIHYEAVGVLGNLVHSSPNIKKEVLIAGALQPVIGLLSSCCTESQREGILCFPLLFKLAIIKTMGNGRPNDEDFSKWPPWLKPLLLEKNFFVQCQIHLDSHNKSECNMYCLDCMNGSLCPLCLENHQEHRVIQIRRSSYNDVVRASEIQKMLDINGIQTYTINSHKVVFLNERPQPRPGKGVTNTCQVCARGILDTFRFCSLGCKVVGTSKKCKFSASIRSDTEDSCSISSTTTREDTVNNNNAVQSATSNAPQTSLSFRTAKRKRKGTPHRAPLA